MTLGRLVEAEARAQECDRLGGHVATRRVRREVFDSGRVAYLVRCRSCSIDFDPRFSRMRGEVAS